jgi:hypothetical protein
MFRLNFTLILSLLLGINYIANSQISSYHYNQAKAFNEYIGTGEGKWRFKSASTYLEKDVTFTRVSLNKKDIQGNDLFRYDFMYGETLCSLVPINTIYPLAYVLMRKQGKEFYEGINNNKYAYIAIGNGMIASVKFRELESGIGSDDKYKRITCQDDRVDVDLKDQKGYIQSGTFIKGKGSGKPFSNAREFFEAESLKFELGTSTSDFGTEYKGLSDYYQNLSTYIKNQLNSAKEKGHNGAFDKIEEGEYYYYGKPFTCKEYPDENDVQVLPGLVKIKFERKGEKVISLLIQNSFNDEKFYDKEKFYVRCPINSLLTDNGKSLIVIDDKIVAVGTYGKSFNSFEGVFSKQPYDIEAINWTLDYDKKFWLIQSTSEKYFCETELETEYSAAKDELHFNGFIQKLYNIYSGLKK